MVERNGHLYAMQVMFGLRFVVSILQSALRSCNPALLVCTSYSLHPVPDYERVSQASPDAISVLWVS